MMYSFYEYVKRFIDVAFIGGWKPIFYQWEWGY